MNKKGFTLIELIAVITILGIITLITVPIVNNSLKKAKIEMLVEQTNRIVDAAKKYILESNTMLNYDAEEGISRPISIVELKKYNYLENKDIINPVSEEMMNGCVFAEYVSANNKFNYTYYESCVPIKNYNNAGRLIYYYDNTSVTSSTIDEFNEQLKIEFNIDVYSNYGDKPIYLYDEVNAIMFDKKDKHLTMYVGQAYKTDDLESAMEVYYSMALMINEMANTFPPAKFMDLYVDVKENIVFMGMDAIRAMEGEDTTEAEAEAAMFDNHNIQTIDDLCTLINSISSTGDCGGWNSLGNIKLDN